MKKIIYSLLLFVPQLVFAQIDFPQGSPKAEVSQVIGLNKVTVAYSSPAVKGRKIWGELVPYKAVWRTGANEATQLEFSDTAIISGNKVPPGKYALFAIPEESEWTIVLNKDFKQWGAYAYSEKQDVIRVKVKPAKSAEFNERLLYTITPGANNDGTINLYWENVKVSLPVETDAKTRITQNIKKALGEGEGRWSTLTEAALYYHETGMDATQALKWIDESISLKKHYWNYWTKGKILAKQKKYAEAVKAGQLALQIGAVNPDNYFTNDKVAVARDVEEWKKK